MKTIKAIIVDDEDGAREVLQSQLTMYCKNVQVVDSCNSVDTAAKSIELHSPELVFLDINMPGKDGFELIRQQENPTFKTIFTTAYNQYALKAIKFSALDYLLKPIDVDELIDAVGKVSKQTFLNKSQLSVLQEHMADKTKIQKIILPTQTGHLVELLNNIIRIEADSNYSIFYFSNGKKNVICRTLKYYEELLQQCGFYRIHQSHIVNLKHIHRYSKGDNAAVLMSDGITVGIARNKKAEFLEVFFEGTIH